MYQDVTTRGSYYPDKSLATAAVSWIFLPAVKSSQLQNPPLFLHVTSTSKAGLEKAIAKIDDMMQQELPNLIDERRFRRRDTEQVERDEYGRVLRALPTSELSDFSSANGLKSAFQSRWRTCQASTSVRKSLVKVARMSSTFRPRQAVEYRLRDAAAASWSTPLVRSPTRPCTSTLLVPSPTRSHKPNNSAKIYWPVFERTTSASKLTLLLSDWSHTQMAMARMHSEVITQATAEAEAITSPAITAMLKQATNPPTRRHRLLAQPPPQSCLQLIGRLPITMPSTMRISPVAIHMLHTVGTRITWHTTNSTINKLSSKLLRRQRMVVTKRVRLHRHLECDGLLLNCLTKSCTMVLG